MENHSIHGCSPQPYRSRPHLSHRHRKWPVLPSWHFIPHTCSLAPGCGKLVHRQQHGGHMATETRAKPCPAFGSLNFKHCVSQHEGRGCAWSSPNPSCFLHNPCKQVPLPPSGPGESHLTPPVPSQAPPYFLLSPSVSWSH